MACAAHVQAGRSEAAASAFAIMRSCQLEGLEQALRDLYKSCFVLMQVRLRAGSVQAPCRASTPWPALSPPLLPHGR